MLLTLTTFLCGSIELSHKVYKILIILFDSLTIVSPYFYSINFMRTKYVVMKLYEPNMPVLFL